MVSVNKVHWANFSLQTVRFVNPIFDVSLSLFCKKMVALDAKKYFISVLFDFFPWCFVMRALRFAIFWLKTAIFWGKYLLAFCSAAVTTGHLQLNTPPTHPLCIAKTLRYQTHYLLCANFFHLVQLQLKTLSSVYAINAK